MEFDNSFDQRKTYPRPICTGIKLIEQTENIFLKLSGNADPVIPNVKNWHIRARPMLADLDPWRRLIPHKFCRVIDQVLHHLHKALTIAKNRGKFWLDTHRDIPLGDSSMQKLQDIGNEFIELDLLRFIDEPAYTRQFQQVA